MSRELNSDNQSFRIRYHLRRGRRGRRLVSQRPIPFQPSCIVILPSQLRLLLRLVALLFVTRCLDDLDALIQQDGSKLHLRLEVQNEVASYHFTQGVVEMCRAKEVQWCGHGS